jgi:hypothetical protein
MKLIIIAYFIYQICPKIKWNRLSTKIITFLTKHINIEKTYNSYVHKSSWDPYFYYGDTTMSLQTIKRLANYKKDYEIDKYIILKLFY